MRHRLLVPLLLLAACHGRGEPVEPDSGSDVHVDTGLPADTDTDTDTDTEPPAPIWTDAALAPGSLVVDVGATFTYRLRGTSPDGVRATPEAVTWTVGDEAVATVADGVATAIGVGSTTVTASWDGGEASATLTVQDSGRIEVTVVDSSTGLAVADTGVQVDELVIDRTDASGFSAAEGIGAAPVSVCAWSDGYVSICASGVVGRRIVLPIRPKGTDPQGVIEGRVDMEALSPGASQIAVGVAVPALATSPWWTSLDDLVGEPRELTIYGVDVTLPSNVVVKGSEERFSIEAAAGDRAIWALGTVLPLADALAAGSGDKDPFGLLVEHISSALWTSVDGIVVPADATVDAGTLTIVDPLPSSLEALLPPLPAGTAGDEQALLLSLSEQPGGHIATGLGMGSGTVPIRQVTTPAADTVLALVQAGGLGSGNGYAASVASVDGGTVILPDWIGIPTLPTVHPADDRFDLTTDGAAQIVLATVIDRKFHERDLLVPAGAGSFAFHDLPAPLDRGSTEWSLRVVATDVGHFEEMIASGSAYRDALTPIAIGVSRVDGSVAATP